MGIKQPLDGRRLKTEYKRLTQRDLKELNKQEPFDL